ncbi:hypothetical protein TMES_18245 [Thalassospira mesophila]|uniref:Uncharacterized protein n=1 Tax=Thalassospira mesophila TaxID=1293891 RepID=A0A1Y2KWN9_9PROT|nr:hypothetical protein TMES_18245 [Thalassospira mesophila]
MHALQRHVQKRRRGIWAIILVPDTGVWGKRSYGNANPDCLIEVRSDLHQAIVIKPVILRGYLVIARLNGKLRQAVLIKSHGRIIWLLALLRETQATPVSDDKKKLSCSATTDIDGPARRKRGHLYALDPTLASDKPGLTAVPKAPQIFITGLHQIKDAVNFKMVC